MSNKGTQVLAFLTGCLIAVMIYVISPQLLHEALPYLRTAFFDVLLIRIAANPRIRSWYNK